MKNSDMPAIPTKEIDLSTLRPDGLDESGRYAISNGLTKREMFAMHAMQAMLTSKFAVNFNGDSLPDENDTLCECAVHYADALLKELEK